MPVSLPLLQEQLRAQHDLTVVERFSRLHESGAVDEGPLYEARIPLSKPNPGQQYGFSVDLDACTGCKACVVGCNKMNGLDENETWRSVGVIHGGTEGNPIQQTVTTACHHCVEPACMHGCPVGAYEKNPVTGIVKHLDDQCIGCQYCTLTCPYEVPQYNDRLGIVRKCDMCQDRLEEGEAPACVEACPNGAISIRIVEVNQAERRVETDAFLPAAPSPSITSPTTYYETKRDLPRNVLPANFFNLRPAEKHTPLAVMLVLTQLSVGAYVVDAVSNWQWPSPLSLALGRAHSLLALALGLIALGAATFHLGRPLYAFRAFIGLRRSWMSREIIALGGFIKVAVVHALSYWKPEWFEALGVFELLGVSAGEFQRGLSLVVAGAGVLAAFCSAMIYIVTRREVWRPSTTLLKFVGTGAWLGFGALALTTALVGQLTSEALLDLSFRQLVFGMMLSAAAKLGYEVSLLRHLWDDEPTDFQRSALLLTNQLRPWTIARFALGVVGGLLIPGILLLGEWGLGDGVALASMGLALVVSILGEFAERTLYFTAATAPKMPGAVGQ